MSERHPPSGEPRSSPERGPVSARERWDERYATADFVWDVAPNRFVEEHLADLAPGSAIDLAAGEGRNAVWLAGHGWSVTAVDFSAVGLAKARRLAQEHGVADRLVTVRADVLTWEPGEAADLVLVAYLQLPGAEQERVLRRVGAWLRPGGTFFLVAHDRTNVADGWGGPQDPEVCYDLAATLAAIDGLEVVSAGIAERPVETEAGTRIALDTLVIARSPAA
jgi:SAM-dependent methyltransferase